MHDANAVRLNAGMPVPRGLVLGSELVFSRAGPERSARIVAPPPRRPTLILGEGERERAFATLADLADALHTLRKGRPIRLQPRAQARAAGASTFPAIDVFVTDGYGDDRWLCAVAIQWRNAERLRNALEAAEPQDGVR